MRTFGPKGIFGESGALTRDEIAQLDEKALVEIYGRKLESRDWRKLIDLRQHRDVTAGHQLPASDHVSLHRDKEGKYTFISQPYHVDMGDAADMLAAAERFGLHFTIDGISSHYPGACVRIIWRRASDLKL